MNVVLVLCVLTDTQHRDIYHWFLCIPLLFLYASGVRACVAALVFICVQTTILRYVRQSYDLTTLPVALREVHNLIQSTTQVPSRDGGAPAAVVSQG